MRTPHLIVLSVLLASPAFAAAPDGVRVTYDVTVAQSPGSLDVVQMQGKYFITKNSVRFETDNPKDPNQQTVVIANSKPKNAFLLFPSRKAYMDISGKDRAKTKGAAPKDESATAPFKATGEERKIAGYACKVFSRDLTDRHEEVCSSASLVEVFKDLQRSLPKHQGGMSSFPTGLDGLPLEYAVRGKEGRVAHMTMRVKDLSKTPLEQGLFEIPKGYQKDKGFEAMGSGDLKQLEELKKQMEKMGKPRP